MRINRNHLDAIKDRPITAQRKLVLDILKEGGSHLHAKKLYQLAVERDRNISLATVYRTLRLFKELGLVDEIRLDEGYCYYELKRAKEHYHLLCMTCGRVIEFESPLIAQLLAQVQGKYQFRPLKAIFCLEGCCQDCTQKQEADYTYSR